MESDLSLIIGSFGIPKRCTLKCYSNGITIIQNGKVIVEAPLSSISKVVYLEGMNIAVTIDGKQYTFTDIDWSGKSVFEWIGVGIVAIGLAIGAALYAAHIGFALIGILFCALVVLPYVFFAFNRLRKIPNAQAKNPEETLLLSWNTFFQTYTPNVYSKKENPLAQ